MRVALAALPRLANRAHAGMARLRARMARSSLEVTAGSIAYKAEEASGRHADKVVLAIKSAPLGIDGASVETHGDLVAEVFRAARSLLPPGTRRKLRGPVRAGGDYLFGRNKRKPLFEAIEVTGVAPPADAVRRSGWSPAVAAVRVDQTRWEGVGTYIPSRLGPVVHVIDSLTSRDRLLFTNLDIASAAGSLPPAARIERLNLPVSSYEKSLHLLHHADESRTLVLGDFRGKAFLDHFQLLVRARLEQGGSRPAIATLESAGLFKQHVAELRAFFKAKIRSLGGVDTVVVAYPDAFAAAWKPYAAGTVRDTGPGAWRADLFRLPGGKRVAVLSTPGDFYGDFLGKALRALVDDVPSIRRAFFAGSGGSLHAREPYSLVLPATVVGPGGRPVRNVLTSGSAGLVHESALSPLAETPGFLAAARSRQVSTMDMEMGGIADALAGTGVEVGFGVVVTDFPAGQVGNVGAELAFQRGSAKQAAAAQLPGLVERFLATGVPSHDHAIETAVGKTVAQMSAGNMRRRLAALGSLTPEERRLFETVRALPPTYALRIPPSRLGRLVDDGVLAKRQVVTLLRQKVTPFTPDSEDQLYRALDYTFGNLGFHDGDPAYGEVVLRLRPETWLRRSWATTRAGVHAIAAASGDGPLLGALSKVSGRAGKRLDLADAAQRTQLAEARRIFSEWVLSANDYSAELAAQAVERLRRGGPRLRRRLLEAGGDDLRRILGQQRLGRLEGKIRGALTLSDVESVAVPAGTPAELIRRIRAAGVAVEVRPAEAAWSPRILLGRLKSWLFVGPSEVLSAETAGAPRKGLVTRR